MAQSEDLCWCLTWSRTLPCPTWLSGAHPVFCGWAWAQVNQKNQGVEETPRCKDTKHHQKLQKDSMGL